MRCGGARWTDAPRPAALPDRSATAAGARMRGSGRRERQAADVGPRGAGQFFDASVSTALAVLLIEVEALLEMNCMRRLSAVSAIMLEG